MRKILIPSWVRMSSHFEPGSPQHFSENCSLTTCGFITDVVLDVCAIEIKLKSNQIELMMIYDGESDYNQRH